MSEGNGGRVVLIQVRVSDPIEVKPGHFETHLTHPNLVGTLVISHGAERDALLDALTVDVKSFDPVSALFQHLVEWRKSI